MNNIRLRALFIGFSVLLLSASGCAGCIDDGGGINSALPDPALSKDSLDFGQVEVGSTVPLLLDLENNGTGLLAGATIDVVADPEADADYSDWFTVTPRTANVSSGAPREITVTFAPIDVGPVQALLKVSYEGNTAKKVNEWTAVLTGEGYIPDVVVEPTNLDFGSVVVETTVTRSVQVSNRGNETVCITARELAGQARQHYRVTLPANAEGDVFCVEPGESTEIDISFVPNIPGRHLATLQLDICDACAPVKVNLLGVGISSGLIVTPRAIDFGAVNPNACVSDFVKFENVGNTVVTISLLENQALVEGQAPDPAFEILAEAPFTLINGETKEVEVTFCPTDLRLHLGQLHWKSSDTKNPEDEIVLSGQGGGPDIEIIPPVLDFGPVGVGAPQTRRVVVTNVGYEELIISNYEIRGSDAFTIESTPESSVLGVGEIGEILVKFAPTGESNETAQLVVTSDDADELEAVSELRATGLDLGECVYEVQPPQLNFGIVERNRKKTLEFGISVSPASPGACLVSVLELTPDSDPEFTLPEGQVNGLILQPGEIHRVPVEFLPPRYAPRYQGAVRFYISDPDNPEHVVPFTGSSRQADVLIAPDDLDFGVIKVGCSTPIDKQFCIYNTGNSTIHLTGLELVESGPGGEFLFKSVPPGLASNPPSVSIAKGASACFTMAYKPRDYGQDSAAVYVTLEEFTDPFVITIIGTGADQAVQTDTFVQLDQPQADILFVIDNSGSMGQEQAALASNFDAFIEFAILQQIDYHLAVVSTDTDDLGIFVPVDGSRERVITPELADPEGTFRQNVQLGINGSATEQGLETAYMALTEPNISDPDKNGGFLRPDAYLALIFISDEEDQSTNTADFYLNFFWNIKGFRRKDLFSASAIVSEDPPCGTACGDSYDAGLRYTDIQQRTGGIWESICTCDWAQALQDLSMIAFGYKTTFFLNNVPEQPWQDKISVVVHRTDGTSYTAEPRQTEDGNGEWWYDVEDNAVEFNPLSKPEPGDTIEVTYSVQCKTT